MLAGMFGALPTSPIPRAAWHHDYILPCRLQMHLLAHPHTQHINDAHSAPHTLTSKVSSCCFFLCADSSNSCSVNSAPDTQPQPACVAGEWRAADEATPHCSGLPQRQSAALLHAPSNSKCCHKLAFLPPSFPSFPPPSHPCPGPAPGTRRPCGCTALSSAFFFSQHSPRARSCGQPLSPPQNTHTLQPAVERHASQHFSGESCSGGRKGAAEDLGCSTAHV